MTQPPDWALAVPSTPGVHPSGTESTAFTRPFTQAQLLEIGAQFLEQFLAVVVKAVVGAFIPGANGAAFDQLSGFFTDLFGIFGGSTGLGQAGNFFTNLLSLLGGPALTGAPGSFNPITAAEDFIANVLNPTGLLASVTAIVEALTGQSGGLNLLGPLTGLFGPIIDLFDGTGSTTGASNFTDNGDGTGLFDLGALGNLIDNGDGTAMSVGGFIENLTGLAGTLQSSNQQLQDIIDSIFNALNFSNVTGNQTDVIAQALQNIPFLNILGIGGPGNIGGSLQGTWDNLISGFVGASGTGAGLADLFNIGQQVSSSASQGRNAWNILGIRTNKSMDRGFLPTSNSNIPLSVTAFAATIPTVPVTQSVSTVLFHRVEESAPIGVLSWQGAGNSNISDFRVNVWKVDPVGNKIDLVHRSANIIGDIAPSTVGGKYPWNVYQVPSPIASVASECYGFELTVVGTGTHTVVGATSNTADHPFAFPKNYAARRNSGTGTPPANIAAGSIAYSNKVPFIEPAITTGAGADTRDPQTTPFSTAGGTTIPFPSWAKFAEAVLVPGGGGGHQGGTWGIGGAGGDSGAWAAITWQRGVDFAAAESPILSITVGAPGSAGFGGNGGNGGASIVTLPATTGHSAQTITAAGGVGANSFDVVGSDHVGGGPGNFTYNSVPYVGGVAQNSYGAAGAAPGGGGAGGNWISFQPGGPGAPGAVWIRFYQ